MNQIEIINIMNEAMIKFLKEKNMDYSANVEIRENLKDEAYFFKIDKIKAYKILEIERDKSIKFLKKALDIKDSDKSE